MLDLTAINEAYQQLVTSLYYCKSEFALKDPELFKQLRTAAIKSFEFTYELSIKMIRRKLIEFETIPEVDKLSYRDLIRMAAQKTLINDPKVWFEFRNMRNITSHTYNQAKADKIYKHLAEFVKHIEQLITNLGNSN